MVFRNCWGHYLREVEWSTELESQRQEQLLREGVAWWGWEGYMTYSTV